MKKPICALLACTMVGGTGCASVGGVEGPWSVLVSGALPSGIDGSFVPLLVSSLNGETPTTYSVITKPGIKQLVLDTPKTARDRGPSQRLIELDMKPCKRYFVAGKMTTTASLSWTPVVFRIEPIGECLAEFKLTASTK